MFGKAYLVDEVQVCVQDFSRGVVVEHLYQQRYYAFYDYSVRVGCVLHSAVVKQFCIEPYSALASFYQVLRSLV